MAESLTVRAISGQQYVIPVSEATLVSEIKQALFDRTDLLPEHSRIPIERQLLVNCGAPLEDDSSVEDEFLLDQTVITWIIRPGPPAADAIAEPVHLSFRVGMASSEEYHIILDADWTIARAIEEMVKECPELTHAEGVRVIYTGQVCDPEYNVYDYDFEEATCCQVIFRRPTEAADEGPPLPPGEGGDAGPPDDDGDFGPPGDGDGDFGPPNEGGDCGPPPDDDGGDGGPPGEDGDEGLGVASDTCEITFITLTGGNVMCDVLPDVPFGEGKGGVASVLDQLAEQCGYARYEIVLIFSGERVDLAKTPDDYALGMASVVNVVRRSVNRPEMVADVGAMRAHCQFCARPGVRVCLRPICCECDTEKIVGFTHVRVAKSASPQCATARLHSHLSVVAFLSVLSPFLSLSLSRHDATRPGCSTSRRDSAVSAAQ